MSLLDQFDSLYAKRRAAFRKLHKEIAPLAVLWCGVAAAANIYSGDWAMAAFEVVLAGFGYRTIIRWNRLSEPDRRAWITRKWGSDQTEVGPEEYGWVEEQCLKWPDLREGVKELMAGGVMTERGFACVWREVRRREELERGRREAEDLTRARTRIIQ